MSWLKNKRIFITGGSGTIGKPLVQLLLSKGITNLLVGDLKPSPKVFPSSLAYRKGDLNELTQDELNAFAPAIVIHLAATFERLQESPSFLENNFRNNVALSTHLLKLLKSCSTLQTIVFASSYLIYDKALYLFEKPPSTPCLLNEASSLAPRNLIGAAKYYHEAELHFFNQFMPHVRCVCGRIFRSFGKSSRDVISRWIRATLNNEPLSVYNENNSFDYIYADDVAEALYLLATNQNAKGIYNIGSNTSRTIRSVVSILKNYFPKTQIIHKDEPNSLLESSQADCTKLFTLLNWRPKFTLEQGIKAIIDYEKNYPILVKNKPSAQECLLITSISKKIPLLKAVQTAIRKSGKSLKVIGADLDLSCIGSYFVDDFWNMPPLQEVNFEFFIQHCKEKNIRYIVPTRDGELTFFAKHKGAFNKEGIAVCIPSLKTVQTCLDKRLLHDHLALNGYLFPHTSASLKNLEGEYFVVKEAFGSGSKKIGICLPYHQANTHAQQLSLPIFQVYIKGKEFSADIYLTQKGNVQGVVLRWREKVEKGESQVTTTFKNTALETLVKQMAQSLELTGHAVIQGIIEAQTHKTYFIDVNCRFGGTSSLSIASGLDSFYWFILEANHIKLPGYSFCYKENLRLIRYPQDSILLAQANTVENDSSTKLSGKDKQHNDLLPI